MAPLVKTKLKRARDALGKKDFAAARDAATDVLSYEPENYNANVFLGLALLELGLHEQSEQAYHKAINSSPDQLLAWQGISKFYEQTQQWDKYVESLLSLMELYAKSDDPMKCAEIVQKYVEYRRERGTRRQLIDALYKYLPGSSLYPVLSHLPAPDPTAPTSTTTFAAQLAIHDSLTVIEDIVRLTETEEDEILKREVERRRMRLGSSGPEELRKEVGRDIWGTSKLPELYGDILNHPNTSDDLRRATESKLLRYKQRYQYALPLDNKFVTTKVEIGKQIEDLVNGVVLLNIPDELAWTICIEGKDTDSIEGYDFGVLRRFTKLFPKSPFSRLIQGYFRYIFLPPQEEIDVVDIPSPIAQSEDDDDSFDVVLEAFDNLPSSLFAHRILGDIYGHEEDHQNAIKIAERGLELVHHFETHNARKLPQVCKAFKIILATGLVHLFPPKHHTRALRMLDEVLDIDSKNVPCLMGRAYISQAACRWSEAIALFEKVAGILQDDIGTGLEAQEERAWCLAQLGGLEASAQALEAVCEELELLEGNETRKARVWWRLGKCYWDLGAREDAYRHFITSLKRSPSFAPAFTSLGIYYSEFVTPPDPSRASKCFQKAFELDAREAEAGRRLADGFAEEREWDLVEVVARRTIEGEGGLEGGIGEGEKAAMARHRPTNSWAWKALGVVDLSRKNRRSYPAAIQAFQVALRTDQDDGLSWLRLGESYAKAGRHAAALKALLRSRELLPEDWMCSYQIGEVQRQTGLLKEAIDTFEDILRLRPTECGVLVSLVETQLALGRSETSTGYLSRAQASFLTSISVALRVIDTSPGFRRIVWKFVVDALLELSKFSTFFDPEAVHGVFSQLSPVLSSKTDQRLEELIEQPILSDTSSVDGSVALKVAVATCSYRVSLFTKDDDAIGSAWFDLGLAFFQLTTHIISNTIRDKAGKDAIDCVRLALMIDPGNLHYWNAFGCLNFGGYSKVAQHAFIKALDIDSKNAAVWTNLGLLYLHNNDLMLANEALHRAQVLDPDYTLAWVGQGLVASANVHETEAKALFAHAIGLTADVPEADLEYSCRVFRQLSRFESHFIPARELLIPSFFSLDRYCRRRSGDPCGLHLFGLVCERLGHLDLGVQMVSQAINLLESAYEDTEDSEIERQYAIANTNLGRLRLSTHNYGGALEAFETAFSLLSAEDDKEETVISRTMCHYGCGLAHFYLGELEAAISMFQSALGISEGHSLIHGQVAVLLSQVLWSIGTEDYKEAAKNHLLQCITTDPENLAAITALAGMGLLTDDDTLVDAALSEILALPFEQRQQLDPRRDVQSLLRHHYLAQGDVERATSLAQQAVHAEPARQSARQDLALLTVHQGRPSDTLALLSQALDVSLEDDPSELHKSLRIVALALSHEKTVDRRCKDDALTSAQKAIKLAPWDLDNWRCLAYVRNSTRPQ